MLTRPATTGDVNATQIIPLTMAPLKVLAPIQHTLYVESGPQVAPRACACRKPCPTTRDPRRPAMTTFLAAMHNLARGPLRCPAC